MAQCGDRQSVIQKLLSRCNELGKMTEEEYAEFVDVDQEKEAA